MKVKGAPGWGRGARQKGAWRHQELPSGDYVAGRVRSNGSWEVRLATIDENDERNGKILAEGTYGGPLRKGCAAADISIAALVRAAKERA